MMEQVKPQYPGMAFPFTLPNATLGTMTDDAFNDALDKWTVEAKGAPYV